MISTAPPTVLVLLLSAAALAPLTRTSEFELIRKKSPGRGFSAIDPGTIFGQRNLKAQFVRVKEVNQVLKLFVAIQNTLAAGRDEEGQTMAEYGVVLAVITIGIVVALTALAGGINGALSSVTSKL